MSEETLRFGDVKINKKKRSATTHFKFSRYRQNSNI